MAYRITQLNTNPRNESLFMQFYGLQLNLHCNTLWKESLLVNGIKQLYTNMDKR